MRIDYYTILEISPNCSDDEIKAAYRKLARQYHPDVNPHDREAATERLRQINEAYEVLSDPEERREYDGRGNGNSDQTGSRPSPATDSYNRYTPPPSYIEPMRRRIRGREWSAIAILIFAMLRALHPVPAVNDQHFAPDPLTTQSTSTSERILTQGVPQSTSATAAYSDLSALSAELQDIRPQIESIHSQGDREYSLASSQPFDPSTPGSSEKRATVSALGSDLHTLESAYNDAYTALGQPAPTAPADTQLEVITVANEICVAKAAARDVASDVRALRGASQ